MCDEGPETTWICEDRKAAPTLDRLKAIVDAEALLQEGGALLYFDLEEYEDPEDRERQRYRDCLKLRGLYHPRKGIGMSQLPSKVVDMVEAQGFEIAAWVGRHALTGSPERLTVITAHEIRHVQQYCFDPQLHYGGRTLSQGFSWMMQDRSATIKWHENPVERDAESWARDVGVRIYGEDMIQRSYPDDLDFFRTPLPVLGLSQVREQLRAALTTHYPYLKELAARDNSKVYQSFGHLAEQVNWPGFRLEPFPIRGIDGVLRPAE